MKILKRIFFLIIVLPLILVEIPINILGLLIQIISYILWGNIKFYLFNGITKWLDKYESNI